MMKIAPNIYYRYEKNFDDGLLIIFNQISGELYEADENAWAILDYINAPESTEENIYSNVNLPKETVDLYLEQLLEMGIVVNGN